MRLSVHDLIAMKKGESPEQAMARTRDFVQKIDRLNYTRYWFAEHHNSPYLASVSPELIASHMSAVTENIRLGTGGTMIMHYSPLKIAENIKTMQAMAPNRADIGLGRAPGSGENEIIALAQGRPGAFSDMYDKIEIILNYLKDADNPSFYGKTRAVPQQLEHLPQAWMLGSSGQSAQKAAELGLGYSFAKFFGIKTEAEVFQIYRDRFQASEFFDESQISVSYVIIVADTEEEAFYHFKPVMLNLLAVSDGKQIPIQNPEELKDYQLSEWEETYMNHYLREHFVIVGDKQQVEEKLHYEIERYGIDEIMAYAPIYDDGARFQSYRMLAEIFNLI